MDYGTYGDVCNRSQNCGIASKIRRVGALVAASAVIVGALIAQSASAQALFTTADDWGQWAAAGGATAASTTAFDTDGSTVNGAGNLITPGGAGTGGLLQLTRGSAGNFGEIANISEGGNSAFLLALDPGCNPGAQVSVAYSGVITMDYSVPSTNNISSGTYFQLGLEFQYNANSYYGTAFPSSTTDLGYTDPNGGEVFRATIPYTINAGNFYGFGLGVVMNSDYVTSTPFNVDNIQVVPEPSTYALLGVGLIGLCGVIRRRRVVS